MGPGGFAMHLSPFGNLVVLFAVVGVCTLAVWTIDLADRLLTRFVPFLKEQIRRRRFDWARRRALKIHRPMSQAERAAMHQGMQEAIEAFRRADIAAHGNSMAI
jgi:hypothetical protein